MLKPEGLARILEFAQRVEDRNLSLRPSRCCYRASGSRFQGGLQMEVVRVVLWAYLLPQAHIPFSLVALLQVLIAHMCQQTLLQLIKNDFRWVVFLLISASLILSFKPNEKRVSISVVTKSILSGIVVRTGSSMCWS